MFDGVWTMLATPMDERGELALNKLQSYVDNQVASGISGVMVLGSTGEFYALEKSERQQVLNEALKAVDDRIEMAAGANAGSTKEVIANAQMAKDAGYKTILLAPPFYSNPDQTHLARHFEAVANAVDIDIILYDNPVQAGVEIGFDVLERLAANPRFVAVKEASGRLQRLFAIQHQFAGRYEIISGVDDLALDFMLWGVKCWMSGPSNFLAAEFVNIHRLAFAGDWISARDQMSAVMPLIAEIESGKYMSRIKYCANRVGLDVGPTRGPIFELEPDEKRGLDDHLRSLGKAIS